MDFYWFMFPFLFHLTLPFSTPMFKLESHAKTKISTKILGKNWYSSNWDRIDKNGKLVFFGAGAAGKVKVRNRGVCRVFRSNVCVEKCVVFRFCVAFFFVCLFFFNRTIKQNTSSAWPTAKTEVRSKNKQKSSSCRSKTFLARDASLINFF